MSKVSSKARKPKCTKRPAAPNPSEHPLMPPEHVAPGVSIGKAYYYITIREPAPRPDGTIPNGAIDVSRHLLIVNPCVPAGGRLTVVSQLAVMALRWEGGLTDTADAGKPAHPTTGPNWYEGYDITYYVSDRDGSDFAGYVVDAVRWLFSTPVNIGSIAMIGMTAGEIGETVLTPEDAKALAESIAQDPAILDRLDNRNVLDCRNMRSGNPTMARTVQSARWWEGSDLSLRMRRTDRKSLVENVEVVQENCGREIIVGTLALVFPPLDGEDAEGETSELALSIVNDADILDNHKDNPKILDLRETGMARAR